MTNKHRIWISLILTIFLSGCASRLMELDLPPVEKNLSGSWQFISQDENAYLEFKRRAQFASTRAITDLNVQGTSRQRRRNQSELPNHLLMDMLVSLVSLPINELFIEQTTSDFAVDYGVAGYHRFKIAQENELLIGGVEIKATAGWKSDQMLVQMLITDQFQIIQKFRLMDNSNLLETLQVNMGDEQSISHQRWYSLNTK